MTTSRRRGVRASSPKSVSAGQRLATWQAALDAGWSDTELTEVSVHIALNLSTNHVNHLAQTDLGLPPAPGL